MKNSNPQKNPFILQVPNDEGNRLSRVEYLLRFAAKFIPSPLREEYVILPTNTVWYNVNTEDSNRLQWFFHYANQYGYTHIMFIFKPIDYGDGRLS